MLHFRDHTTTTPRPRRTLAPVVALLLGVLSGCTGPTDRAARGQELYGYCVQCHGVDGGGNEDFRAPRLAGLPAWYVEAQLTKFRIGARGDNPDDVDGLRMRPMSRTLATADEVHLVAQYVGSLPPIDAPATLDGDFQRGRTLFTPCVQCHGERAQGNQDKNAPRLAGANDWYLVAQLHKFQAGIRGADPQDNTGGQMRAMSTSLSDEQAILDVVAYITTLD